MKRDLTLLRWLQFVRDSELVGQVWSDLSREIGRFQAAIGTDFETTAPRIGAGVPQFVRLVDEVQTSSRLHMAVHARP